MNQTARFASLFFALGLLTSACGGGNGGDAGVDAGTLDATTFDAGPPDLGPPDLGLTPVCTTPTTVPCTDNQILDLPLFTTAATGAIDNTADGSGWMSHVDATAGGFMPTQSFVYARFTDAGLEKVDVGDEAAFSSMDWDIAFRRFIIRLNSGVSGPSCVTGARTAATTMYDTLASPPSGLAYRTEAYYPAAPSCMLVPDGSGLGSPGTALQSFWEYPGCVKMTGNTYVLELASGRHVKLTVTSYYEPSFQATCDSTGSVAMSGNGSGNIRFRWAFIDP